MLSTLKRVLIKCSHNISVLIGIITLENKIRFHIYVALLLKKKRQTLQLSEIRQADGS